MWRRKLTSPACQPHTSLACLMPQAPIEPKIPTERATEGTWRVRGRHLPLQLLADAGLKVGPHASLPLSLSLSRARALSPPLSPSFSFPLYRSLSLPPGRYAVSPPLCLSLSLGVSHLANASTTPATGAAGGCWPRGCPGRCSPPRGPPG